MAAISTIKNLGPVMETEFNAAGVATAEDLRDMGAVLRKEIGGDYILSWDA